MEEELYDIGTEETPKGDWRSYFSYSTIINNIPFFLFLAVIAIVYIYNGHKADKLVRNISATEKNIKELEYEFKTVKSELIFRSKASELVSVVEPMGLFGADKPPMILSDTIELSIARKIEPVIDTTKKDTIKIKK
jgi:Bacteriodetes cell division protein (FtsL-like)